jgi:predicted enzyme related to lactoylglutathione lyase
MPDSNGRFVWYELFTTDLAAARAFYSRVVGWQTKDAQMPGHDYWMFTAGEKPVTGLMTLPEDARKMGTPPNWLGYVGVADVDATAAKVKASGGNVYVPPTDIPNVGRFSIVADPQGAVLGLFKSANPDEDPSAQPTETGRVGWHELFANDQASAFTFYAGLFGWEKKESMDMGEMGVYQTFGSGDTTLGGMMTKPAEVPVPNWHYYFNVGNIDEAAERVKSAGGQIVNGPMEVPGGGFILMGMDPQSAFFALLGSR